MSVAVGKQTSPMCCAITSAMIVLAARKTFRKESLWLGHANLATTEIYVRADRVKVGGHRAIVPPHFEKGKFRPPDRADAMLKAKS